MSDSIFEDGFSNDGIVFLPHYINFLTDFAHLAKSLSRRFREGHRHLGHMAISMATLSGIGIGIIHSNTTSSEKARMVKVMQSAHRLRRCGEIGRYGNEYLRLHGELYRLPSAVELRFMVDWEAHEGEKLLNYHVI